jgi:hypothetical protein
MASRSNLLYSVAAARRVLGLRSSTPVEMREFFKVIWVWAKGRRPTFISKSAFKIHFVEHRKAESRDLDVTQCPHQPTRYIVSNKLKGSSYVVDCSPTQLECTCEDYKMQQQIFGRGCCKHGYAVLSYLGFNSLESYIKAHAIAVDTKTQLPASNKLSEKHAA